MNKQKARAIVDNFHNPVELPPQEAVQLAVDDYLSQIKYLAQQGVAELEFNPPRYDGAIREKLEALDFVFEQRGTPPNKKWFITW